MLYLIYYGCRNLTSAKNKLHQAALFHSDGGCKVNISDFFVLNQKNQFYLLYIHHLKEITQPGQLYFEQNSYFYNYNKSDITLYFLF